MSGFIIRYRYPGITHIRRGVVYDPPVPVGLVYVTHHPELGRGVYSHTYDPSEAWLWPTHESADQAIGLHAWSGGIVIPREGAPMLPDHFAGAKS